MILAADQHLQLLLQKLASELAGLGVLWPLIQPLDGVLPLFMVHPIPTGMHATSGPTAKR